MVSSRNLPPALRRGFILPDVPAPPALELLEHLSTCVTLDFGGPARVPTAKWVLSSPLQDQILSEPNLGSQSPGWCFLLPIPTKGNFNFYWKVLQKWSFQAEGMFSFRQQGLGWVVKATLCIWRGFSLPRMVSEVLQWENLVALQDQNTNPASLLQNTTSVTWNVSSGNVTHLPQESGQMARIMIKLPMTKSLEADIKWVVSCIDRCHIHFANIF